ncbi:MAG: choice-of-anchor J domain-containing protein, partial [Kiritimatiellia bacterium]
MKKLPKSGLIPLLLILLASASRADDYSQDFNTWPFTGIGSSPFYLPLFPTTTNDGWVANEVSVAGDSDPDPNNYIPSPYSAPRAAWLKDLRTGGNPWILSPLLSEGAGLVTFYARGSKSSAYQQRFTVETSTNAVNWTTRASFTNSTVSWTQYSIKLDIYEPVYVRIRKTYDGSIAALYLGIDDISITRPTPFLLITNVTLTPSSPTINDPVQVQATIIPYAGAHTITPTVLWRSTSSAAYSEVTMFTSGSNVYYTAGGGIPAQAIGGSAVEYYIRAEFQGGTPGVHTNFYPAAAPATRLRYVVQPLSAYPQMNITGTATTNMQLVSNYQWQGRLSGTMSSPSFLFASGSESWGDGNPTKTTLPVYGLAESNAPAIAITETVTNHLAFLFHDSDNFKYGIQKCQIAHFDNWTTGGNYVSTPTIQPGGWQINGAKVAPTTDFEDWRQFSDKYLILKYGEGGGSQYLRSPYLPEGAGTLSFRYRHFDDPGSSSAGFKVQVSETGTGTWSDVSEVTNIVSLGYLYFSVNIADRRAKYVRVLNHPSVSTSWLCLDEVVLTYSAATVDLGNPTRNTDNPMVDESVRVSIDITAIYENATNLTCSVFVRPSNSTVFAELPMIRSNDTFYAWIPPGPKGPMYYYFRCTFDGFEGGSVLYPFGGPLTPLSYVISQQFGPDRQQNFNTWPYTGNSGIYPRFTTSTNSGWVANDTSVGGRYDNIFLPDYGYSTPRAAWLNALNLGGNPWVQSPL